MLFSPYIIKMWLKPADGVLPGMSLPLKPTREKKAGKATKQLGVSWNISAADRPPQKKMPRYRWPADALCYKDWQW